MTNCPNCGAPVTSYKCDYCGTVFEEANVVTLYADNRAFVTLYRDVIKAMKPYSDRILKGE